MQATRVTVTSSRASLIAPTMFYELMRENTKNLLPSPAFFFNALSDPEIIKEWTKKIAVDPEPDDGNTWRFQLFYMEPLTPVTDSIEEYLFRCCRTRNKEDMLFDLKIKYNPPTEGRDEGQIVELVIQFKHGNSGWIGKIIEAFQKKLEVYGIPFPNVSFRIEGQRNNSNSINDTALGAVYFAERRLWHQQEQRRA